MVQIDSSGERGAGLLPLTHRGISPAKAPVAVGLERVHAKFVGQGQGLLVVGFGLCDLRGVGVGMDGAELAQCEHLFPTCLLLSGQVEILVRMLPGLLAASH